MEPLDAAGENKAIAALLEWYVEQGVDYAVDEEPHDRFAETAAPVSIRTVAPETIAPKIATAPAAVATAVLLTPDEALHEARSRAVNAATLEELRTLIESFEGCGLMKTATRLVFADGTPGSRVMLVGDAPGADEDREGRPFVGRSGQLLDKMLLAIGLARKDVYIANIVPWRPPGNRKLTPQETAVCLPFILRQIELCRPDILICLGELSAQTLLEQREGISKLRGRWFDVASGDRIIKALATLHPDYLLRLPLQKRLVWRDMLALKAALNA
ncbi:MAG: uracil-DNA glycosylase family protein [Beijerinckiaceae bacterium]